MLHGQGAPLRRVLFAAGALLAASPLAAQEPDSARVHVVRPGDTLWDLSRFYLGDPFLWPEIFRLNRGRVQNPNWIFPRERILIPGLARDRTEVAEAPTPAEPAGTVFSRRGAAPVGGPSFRAETAAEVPVVDQGEFLAAGMLMSGEELRPVGRLAAPAAQTVIDVEIPPVVRVYERVFMRVDPAATVRVGERLHLVRHGRRVRGLGVVVEPTGVAVVEAVEAGTATLQVVELFDAVQVGDLAVPLPEYRVDPRARPRPQTGREGRIVAFEDPQPVYASYDIAFLDLGARDGVAVGDEYVAVLPAARERWGHRPEVEVARLQVVRVTERTASARVMAMQHPALAVGLAVRQVAKMP